MKTSPQKPVILACSLCLGLSSAASAITLISTSVPGTGPFGDGELGVGFGGAAATATLDPAGGGGTVSQVSVPSAAAPFGEGIRFEFGFDNPNSEPFPANILGQTYSFSFDIYYPTPTAGGAYADALVLARWYDSATATNKGETAPSYDGTGVGSGFNTVPGFASPNITAFDTWQTVTMSGYTVPATSNGANNGNGGPTQHLEFNIFTNAADANTADAFFFLRNVQFDVVPEPSSALLSLIGCAALLKRRR